MQNETSLPAVTVGLDNYQSLAERTSKQPEELTPLDNFHTAALYGGMRFGIAAGNCANDLKRRLAYGKVMPPGSDADSFGKVTVDASVEPITLTVQQFRLVHAVLGLMSEAGELMDQLSAHIFAKQPLDEVNIKEEFGDTFWYLAEGHNAVGAVFQQTMQTNIDKLRARYGDKFSEAAALTRDLTKERAVLEGSRPPTDDGGSPQ